MKYDKQGDKNNIVTYMCSCTEEWRSSVRVKSKIHSLLAVNPF